MSYLFYQHELEQPMSLSGDSYLIDIESGDTLNKVLWGLSSNGVLPATWAAKLYAKEFDLANGLKVGEFRLSANATIPNLFELITGNNQIQYQAQFIEGSQFKQVLEVLDGQEKLKHLLTGKSHAEILAALELGDTVKHLEGQFYPDTYAYLKGDSDVSILKRAHQHLNEVLKKEWSTRQKELPLKSPYDALILASIVEKETGAKEERAQIAGVFTRRLNTKMRLQTDPTVIYGLGDEYQGNITRKHLKAYTPYNTYRIKGLPPTPIAMVGQPAIHAALNPEKGETLYFVAKGDGTHAFSNTIYEHNKAVRKYQLRRRSDYRSSHQVDAIKQFKSQQKKIDN